MEFLAAMGAGIVGKLGEMLVYPITMQFKNLIQYEKNMENMKNELKNLEDRKLAIEGMVDADRRNGHHIAPNVEHWLYKVDNIIIENRIQLGDYNDEEVNKNKKCLSGLYPNSVFRRCSMSKRARKRTQDLVSLKEEKLEIISYPAPPPKLGSTFTEGAYKRFVSRESILREIIEKLKDDEFQRISICGMGGVGKTTLVKELIKVIEVDKVFDDISMAIVTQVPDYRKIQGQIGDTLGLKFDKETVQGRACQLLERLKKINKVLIVLDDVWTELDFEAIGLPSNDKLHKGCKILFTSRNEDVCHKMRSQSNFNIPILSKEEAWDLFKDTIGGNFVDKPDIHHIAEEIADECKGLPIAIVTIGKALGNKEKHAWENALEQLRNSSIITSFSEMQEYCSVYSCIELSYNFLSNEEAKSLLLLCCLFPEDFDIPIEVLLRHGVGLGLFKGLGALSKVRNRVHTLVDGLKKGFLLLDSNEEECVKMHDVVRDTVITIASKTELGFVVKCDVGQELSRENTWHHVNAMSLMFDEIKVDSRRLQCPNLKLLQVASKKRQEAISENLFHNMSKLMVLGLRYLCIPSMSSSFRTLENLRALRLEDCQVEDVSIIGKELRNVEILSFARSNIKVLPIEIGKLIFLRLLDLTECNHLVQISSGVLPSLSQLEELYFRVKNFPWEEKSSIVAELKSLSHQLKVFEIAIMGIEVFPKDLALKNLVKFWVYVGDSSTLSHGLVRGGYLHPNILKLNNLYSKYIKENVSILHLLRKSEILNLVDVKQLENVAYELDKEGLPHLRSLSIEFCNNLKYIADTSDCNSSCAFPMVQSLSLHSLDSLKKIFHGTNHASHRGHHFKSFTSSSSSSSSSCQCFGSLRDLKVEFCNKLKCVFSEFPGSSFAMLQHLHVTECYGIECVVSHETDDENSIFKFSNLVELKLQELPSLVGFIVPDGRNELHQLKSQVDEELKFDDDQHQLWSNSNLGAEESVSIGGTLIESKWIHHFPKLEKISLLECPLLEMVFDLQEVHNDGHPIDMLFSQLREIEISWLSKLRHIWGNVPSYIQGFQNLRSLKVKKCDALRYVFTPTIARLLTQLQKLVIHSCQLMEKVVEDDEGEKEKVETFVFDKLDSLTLRDLPSLVSICPDSCELIWPKLRYLCIDGCPKLKTCRPIQTLAKQENHNHSLSNSSFHDIGFSTSRFLQSCFVCTTPNNEMSNTMGKSNFQRSRKMRNKVSLIKDQVSSDDETKTREETRSCMPNLEQLQVKGWESLDAVFQLEQNQHNCIVKMMPMSTSPTSIISGFNNLTLLSLDACHKLKYLFPHSIARLLVRLQEVKVSNCKMVEQLVKREENSSITSPKESCVLEFPSLKRISIISCSMLEVFIEDGEWRKDMTTFHQVQSLTLSHLPNLVSFCHQPCILAQPSSEKYEANNHHKQVKVADEAWRIQRDDPTIDDFLFSNLTYLGIKQCRKISWLFSPSSSASLVSLQELEICDCENIKAIVSSREEIQASIIKIVFPKLQRLKLERLSNLSAFCQGFYGLDFPSLEEVFFGDCHSMEVFSHGPPDTPKLRSITMKVGNLTRNIWMGDLNATAQLSKGIIKGYRQLQGNYSCVIMAILELAFQTSESLGWIKQDQTLHSYFMEETEMTVSGFQSLLTLVPSNVIHIFQNLKNLTVRDCPSLIQVFESEGVLNVKTGQGMTCYELEAMNLHSLPKLIHIWKNLDQVLDFGKLKVLKVEYCGNLSTMMSPSMARNLVQLRHLRVQGCQMMEEIVRKEAEGENKAEIVFPLLNKLELRHLPSLKWFCSASLDLELPFCEEMVIEKCPKMTTFSFGDVSTPKLPNIYKGSYEYVDVVGDLNMTIYHAHSEDLKVAFQRSDTINWIENDETLLAYLTRVTELVVEGCEKLLNCVPSNMLHTLQHLKQLKEEVGKLMDQATNANAAQSAKESCEEGGQQIKAKAQDAADAVKSTVGAYK
ncbi:putative disease resistance protein [Senna tora]|uniref:Putative disease resistance protein n=1 Tax=Senna tora TaxID=362788 RepID=A0A834W6K7_9FABA|nr:putative disease resistance protein [Senna tora]